MRRTLSWIIAAGLAAGPVASHAFGAKGHQVVGAVADRLLNPRATAQVNKLIGMKLRLAATWADCVKDVTHNAKGFHYVPDPRFHEACKAFESRTGITRMKDYASRNWNCAPTGPTSACHKGFHFTDVAIQHDHYDRAFFGTADNDIVGAMTAAIGVLRGPPATTPISLKDKKEALLLLAHLVGDIHQPLHVAAIYLDPQGLPVDPDAGPLPPDARTSTRGGNSIGVGSTDMHSEWDQVSSALKPTALSSKMVADARAVARTPDDPATWPAAWATEAVQDGHTVFDGIRYTPIPGRPGHWVATFDDRSAYLRLKSQVQTRQLVRAGARMAQLLNTIWP